MNNDNKTTPPSQRKGRGQNLAEWLSDRDHDSDADEGATASSRQRIDPVPAKILNKREFIGRVADACDASRAQVRPVVEATLQELGRAIVAGETLALPPFGKARVNRQRTKKGTEVLVLRLRRPKEA